MYRVVDRVLRLRADLRSVREVCVLACRPLLLDRPYEPLDRVVEELDVVEECVDKTKVRGLVGSEEAVMLERVRHDQLDRSLRPDDAGQELGTAPGGDDSEEDLREADVAHRARKCAEVTVERDLETATEGGAVDRGEGGEGQIANRPERLVSGDGGSTCEIRRRHAGELRQVCAGSEDERLAREDEAAPLPLAELREQFAERFERGATEDVRLLPLLAVVHRHEGNGPDTRHDLLEVEAGR